MTEPTRAGDNSRRRLRYGRSLDASSTWIVTGDSHLTTLTDTSGITGTTISNITGNGHTVTYDASANPALGGQTYTLNGGGTLKPAN